MSTCCLAEQPDLLSASDFMENYTLGHVGDGSPENAIVTLIARGIYFAGPSTDRNHLQKLQPVQQKFSLALSV